MNELVTDEPLFSLFVSFYNNGEKYENLLKKLCNVPSFVDVFCIDDGSTDNTLEILNKYNDKFKIYHNENKGCFASCSFGFSIAKGYYVHAIDADDDIDLSLYTDIKNILDDIDIKPDMFTFPKRINKRGKIINVKLKLPKGLFELNDLNFFKYVQPDNYNKIDGFRWNKIFKREIIQTVVLSDPIYNDRIEFFEDFVHTFPSTAKCKYIYNLAKPYYTYYINSGSLSHSPKMCENFFIDEKKIFPYFLKVLEDNNIPSKKLDHYRYMSYAACYYFCAVYKRKDILKEFRKSYFYKPYSRFLILNHPFFYITFKLRLHFLLHIHAFFYPFM